MPPTRQANLAETYPIVTYPIVSYPCGDLPYTNLPLDLRAVLPETYPTVAYPTLTYHLPYATAAPNQPSPRYLPYT
jgi:hypothetical protein